MKKIRNIINIPKSNKYFIYILTIIALVSGSLFFFKINANDQSIIKTYFENIIINNEYQTLIGTIGFKFLIIFLFWIFGISAIGLITNLFIYFTKVFLTATSITCMINLYSIKGLLISLIYAFPSKIITIMVYFILTVYSVNFSLSLVKSTIKKEQFDFKNIISKYNRIFLYAIVIEIFTSLLDFYLTPLLLRMVLK